MPFNWSSLWLSLRVAGIATAGALLPGLWLAYLLAVRSRKTLFAFLAILLATPVLILTWMLLRPAFPWPAGAAAGAVAALPLIALGVRTRIETLDRLYGNAARSLGIGEFRIFWRVMIPLGWRSVAAASAIAFVRVLAEWTIAAAL
jgi:molybdate transport system permease protein